MSKKDKLLVHEMFCYLFTLMIALCNMVMGIYSLTVAIVAMVFLFVGLGFKWWGSKTKPNPPDKWDSHLKSVEDQWGKSEK